MRCIAGNIRFIVVDDVIFYVVELQPLDIQDVEVIEVADFKQIDEV